MSASNFDIVSELVQLYMFLLTVYECMNVQVYVYACFKGNY